jgi:hypothetical protein
MNFFPIAESRAVDAPLRGVAESCAVDAPLRGVAETELLLHPFRGPPPAQHLTFGRKGEVSTRTPPGDAQPSVRGEQTIRTLGLDRIALRERRQPIARHIHETIDDILSPSVTPAEVHIHLKHIHARGRAEELHCGMVRAIFEERLPMKWSELDAQFGGGRA